MIISKRVVSLRNFLIAESVLQELAEFIQEKYLELMKASEAERARGYLRLFKLLMELLSDKPLVVHSYSDYLKALDLAVSRGSRRN